jgi:hypothetical protein
LILTILISSILSCPAENSGNLDYSSADIESIHNSRATDPFDATEAREWLDISLDITYDNPVWLSISTEFKVHEIFLSAPYNQVTADEIRKMYEVEEKATDSEPAILVTLYQKTTEILDRILNKTYPSSFQIVYNPVRDVTSFFHASDENKYDPPIIINQFCRLKMNETMYFTEEEISRYDIKSLSDLIEGSLKLGAKVTQDLTLYAGAGYKVSYGLKVHHFEPTSEDYKDQLSITHKSNEVTSINKERVKFTLDNRNGIYSSIRNINNIALRANIPNVQTKESVHINFDIDMKEFDSVVLNQSTITIHSLYLRESVSKLPSNFSDIIFLAADGIRLFYDNGIFVESDLEGDIDAQLTRFENQLTRNFNATTHVVINLSWNYNTITELEPLYYLQDTGSLSRMGSERAIVGYLSTPVMINSKVFENVSSSTVEGLLNGGAIGRLELAISTRIC